MKSGTNPDFEPQESYELMRPSLFLKLYKKYLKKVKVMGKHFNTTKPSLFYIFTQNPESNP